MRVEHIGDATLYLGDALEILPTLSGVDAVITDPPYGIRYSPAPGGQGWMRGGKTFTGKDLVVGDDHPFDPSPIVALGLPTILWGANHYASRLPDSSCWLVWDKRDGTAVNDFADCEMAWCSWKSPARVFCHRWNGLLRDSERGVKREHPTQKAIALMVWCIRQAKTPRTVLDPYMGSATTGVACAQLGRKFIGIEIEPKYFDIACRRIEQAYAQGKLFEPEQAKPVQEALI